MQTTELTAQVPQDDSRSVAPDTLLEEVFAQPLDPEVLGVPSSPPLCDIDMNNNDLPNFSPSPQLCSGETIATEASALQAEKTGKRKKITGTLMVWKYSLQCYVSLILYVSLIPVPYFNFILCHP